MSGTIHIAEIRPSSILVTINGQEREIDLPPLEPRSQDSRSLADPQSPLRDGGGEEVDEEGASPDLLSQLAENGGAAE